MYSLIYSEKERHIFLKNIESYCSLRERLKSFVLYIRYSIQYLHQHTHHTLVWT